MKLLITGGCGFLGSNLAEAFLRRGGDLVIFDNLYRKGSVDNLSWLESAGKFSFVHGDIRCLNDVSRIIKHFKPDAIFHLAGQVAMTTSIANPDLDFAVNVVGSFNLLESVRKYSPSSIVVYSSTNKVYGDLEYFTYREKETRYQCTEFPFGFDEKISLNFSSPYGCSKGSADQYMLDYHRIFGLKTVVFRHSSMYGGRQFASFDQGWVGWFCKKAVECYYDVCDQPFTICGTGKQVRDLLHADDMISLYNTVLGNLDNAVGQVFNIGGGHENSLSLLELFNFLEKYLGVKLKYTKLPERQSDQRVFVADITKASQLLKWKPKVSAQLGVIKMIEWVKSTFK